jgi:hypothetical protein
LISKTIESIYFGVDVVRSTPATLTRRNSLEEIRQRAAQERAQYQQQRGGYFGGPDPSNPKEFTSDDVAILFNVINNALAGKTHVLSSFELSLLCY